MNRKLIVFITLLACFYLSAQQIVLIKDKETKAPISNATIAYNNTFSETDSNGKAILNLTGKHHIKVSRLGYKPFNKSIIIKNNTVIFLENDNQLEETVVHGHKNHTERTSVTSTLKSKELEQNTSANLGDILTKVEGVSTIKTGGTIVKPVVHGMYGNRIVVLNNGVVQQGQDWSAEHAPEIDPYAVNEINVIKGAEGVKYGSGALGGVVLINPKKLPYHTDKITGKVATILGLNGNSSTFSALVGDNVHENKIAWQVQGTRHISGDIKTADYFLNNTGTNSYSFSGNIGFKKNNFGIEGYYSFYDNTYGIAYISEVGNQDDFDIRFETGQPLRFFPAKYSISSPKQEVTHHLGKINSFWKPSQKSEIKLQYDYQLNNRKEYFVRRANLSDTPAFNTDLATHKITTSYELKWNSVWKSEVGLNYQNQLNENIAGTRIDPIIPNYTNIGFGGYAIQKYKKNPFEISAGIRYDFKTEDVSGIKDRIRFKNNRDFKNWVWSLSGTYHLNQFSFTSNLGMAWRSPHVSELYSNGLKHGSLFYVEGDRNLNPENGLKWINSITYHSDKLYVHLSGFIQHLNNYIYDQPTTEIVSLWGGDYFKSYYQQADAFFRGADLNAGYNFNKNWEYMIKGAVVYATNLDTEGYFPFIPAENFEHEIKFLKHAEHKIFNEIYTGFTHRFTAKQTRFDRNSDLKPSPESYHLFKISGGFKSATFNNKQVSFHISVDNLFNKKYKEYTNRFRYFNHDMGRNIQLKTTINF